MIKTNSDYFAVITDDVLDEHSDIEHVMPWKIQRLNNIKIKLMYLDVSANNNNKNIMSL